MTYPSAALALSDGTVFEGTGFGSARRITGEVVFNTGMVGYPESITDPSYWGQILVQTYPLIGNYGVCTRGLESDGPKIAGYAVSELCEKPSHHSSEKGLEKWLRESGVPGIQGIDVRALTKRLREKGTMLGALEVSRDVDIDSLKEEAKKAQDPNSRDLTAEVTARKAYEKGSGLPVALIDCGTKLSIVRSLVSLGARVTVFPASTPLDTIMKHKPKGLVVSNGPGDPKLCPAIGAVRDALDQGLPILGVCMGNQILGLAAGGDTYKLRFGHRSQNQPCMESGSGRCYITSQNHGFAIDSKSLPKGWREWFVNVNDGTNEGIMHERRPWMSVQFHPEASPGPVDTRFIFERFMKMVKEHG
jgi:carbamoyl-phosphate synthase small subunit